MEEEEQPTETTSLFPAYVQHPPPQLLPSDPNKGASAASQWLQNTSFTTDLSVINDAVTKYDLPREGQQQEEEDKVEEVNTDKRPPQYEMVPSEATASSDEEHRKRKKKKKRRKREESTGSPPLYNYAATLSSSRNSGFQKWASSSTSNDKDYYFDSRGDRDNLAFGCIYRMDVARYKLYNSKKVSGNNYFLRTKKVGLERDSDIDALDTNLRSGGRYWSAKFAAIERHKNLKRVRVLAPSKPGRSSLADFIPLSAENSNSSLVSSVSVVEESWEDEVLRKTKEFNKMTRERPQDESLWLAFAEFQDKVASMQSHKGARLQTLEKKISILEKAAELNPESEDLLLSLMNAYRSRDTTDVLIRKWEKILMSNSGSYKLWREFLWVVQGEFSRFKVSDMRKMYANAIQALAGACIKQHRQVHPSGNATSVDPAIIQLELGLVDVFIGLCRLEWQAGYQELATALFQAEIEYSMFSPFGLSEQSKRRLFEHFWGSNGARIGEDGALGWSTWLEKEEEQRQKLASEEASNVVEEGGWTGWFEPLSRTQETEMPESISENDLVAEEFDVENTKDVEQKDDVESLLKALGIDVAAEADIKVKDTKTWTKWSKAEMSRDLDQWMPLRPDSGHVSHDAATADAEDDEQLLSIILYEDVSDYLFSINSEEARMSLVSQFIDFYDGRIAQWTCTNSSSWVEKTLSLESLPYSLLEDLRKMHDVVNGKLSNPISISLELLLNSLDDSNMRSNMMKFLRNAILLCLKAFPKNYILEEAALVAEELSNTRMDSVSCSVTPCRALAKTLLKNNRQDLLLCGVYAQREAFFGNIDHSRKVFDMALSSIEGLPLDVRPNASLLYFWYAEVELANNPSENSDSLPRAMHILCCLGSGARYTPFKGQPSSLQQLRARQGFKDRIKMLSTTWARGIIDDHSAALICSAALFEELTSGWASALEILEHSFTMVLPERRRHSRQLEFLFNYYVRMLCKNRMELKSSKIWEAIVKGLQIYPFSPCLHNALVEVSHLYSSPNKLRWTFDDYSQKKPSVITWLYALSFEMSTGGSQHRIRGLFERALEDDKLHNSVILWRCYIEYERTVACNTFAAKRVFFRAIHACPWSKKLWLDGFLKLDSILTVKELSDLQEVMRDKELNLRTDIYEILLQDEMDA
ncbi:protein NRDE2 homolog [Sesamum indicum]|uniref:Protein NRDE2 homolog n=1 Tax=Sesamum indicum TaxID=4182 RepID=A0A6I9SS23_SESIN|nr:protein NRDE2 homolog [Sesamum indicum]